MYNWQLLLELIGIDLVYLSFHLEENFTRSDDTDSEHFDIIFSYVVINMDIFK